MQLAHMCCNRQKSDKLVQKVEFMQQKEIYTIVRTAETSDGGTWGRLKSEGWVDQYWCEVPQADLTLDKLRHLCYTDSRSRKTQNLYCETYEPTRPRPVSWISLVQ